MAKKKAAPKAKRKPRKAPKKKRPVGRPRVMNAEKRKLILAALQIGGTLTDAASVAGVDRATIDREAKRNAEFRTNLTRASDQCKLTILKRIIENDDWRAGAWYLARRWPGEYSDAVAKQISVNFTPKDLAELADDDLDALIGRLARGEG